MVFDEPVWVAASGCTDRTVDVAVKAGAEVFATPLGLGASTVAVLRRFAQEPVVFIDGDLSDVRVPTVALLSAAAESGFVGKGAMDNAGRSSSRLPEMAAAAGVGLPDVPPQALTSAYSSYPAGFANLVDLTMVPLNRGSDLMLSLLAHAAGVETVVVPAGPRAHRNRGTEHVENLVAENQVTLEKFAVRYPAGRVSPEAGL